jgi:hypothetical protein
MPKHNKLATDDLELKTVKIFKSVWTTNIAVKSCKQMESVKGNTAQMLKRAVEEANENTNDKLIKRQTTNIQVYI